MSSHSSFNEALISVFKFLPIDDRKSVRLSCRKWHDACNDLEIINREKFVFHLGNVAQMKASLTMCKTLRFDFEFYGLTYIPSIVWSFAGVRMKSLLIWDCELGDRTMSDIILYCSGLTSLSIETPPGPYNPDRLFCSEKVLDNAIQHKVVQNNLQSFQLFTLIYVSPRMYRKIFEIYPNIRKFGLGNSNAYIKEKLLLPRMIESFTARAGEALIKQLSEYPLLKLKELEIGHTNFNTFGVDVLVDLISHQIELEKVKLSITGGLRTEEKIKALLFGSISPPKLKEFQLHGFYDIHFTIDEFSDFLLKISRLESLNLRFPVCHLLHSPRSSRVAEQKLPSIVYDRLKILHLEFNNSRTNDRIYTEILNRCPSLQCLHLKEVNFGILQRIFENHTALRKLSLYNRKIGSADPSKVSKVNRDKHQRTMKYSFKRLRNLEHLDIRGIRFMEINGYTYDVFDAVFSQSNFLNLKSLYFHLRPCDKLFVQKLLDIVSKNAPRLQFLKLVTSHFIGDGDELVNCCKRLKELRVLDVASRSFERKIIEKLFKECPSLRYVGEFHFARRTYSYDRFSGTLKKFDYRYLRIFHKSSIPDDN